MRVFEFQGFGCRSPYEILSAGARLVLIERSFMLPFSLWDSRRWWKWWCCWKIRISVAVLLMRFTWIITLPRELGSKWESCRSPYEILGDEVKVIGGVEFQVAVLLMRFRRRKSYTNWRDNKKTSVAVLLMRFGVAFPGTRKDTYKFVAVLLMRFGARTIRTQVSSGGQGCRSPYEILVEWKL